MLSNVATFAAAVAALPVIAVTAAFAIEVFAGIRPAATASGPPAKVTSAAVIVPAHDEAMIIEATIAALKDALPPRCRLLVVADNCSDKTAALARSAGASVVERRSETGRGKGFALAAARDALRVDPPEVVMVIDADCRIDRNSLSVLIEAAVQSNRPVQSTNLLMPDLGASPLIQLSTFAFFLKNVIRQRGLQRLGGPAHLTGTGMAFPWSVFDRAALASANVVEDLTLGLGLAGRGLPPLFVPQAIVSSPAAAKGGTLIQRERWEGGHFSTIIRSVPGLFGEALRKRDWATFVAALDLSVPPLAMLALFNLAAVAIVLLALFFGGSPLPLMLLVAVLAAALAAVMLAWGKEGRRFASAAAWARVPFYILWKVPMYLRLARKGAPKDWLRTGR